MYVRLERRVLGNNKFTGSVKALGKLAQLERLCVGDDGAQCLAFFNLCSLSHSGKFPITSSLVPSAVSAN